jgi:hypothetical protein
MALSGTGAYDNQGHPGCQEKNNKKIPITTFYYILLLT